jgi:hypothetical protein
MAKCGAVADSTARLACYDALNPTVKAAQAEPPPPLVAAAPPPVAAAAPVPESAPWYDPFRVFGTAPSQQVRPEQFGAENLSAPPPPPGKPGEPAPPAPPAALDEITATVTDFSVNYYGHLIVVLSNGQIWQQASSDTLVAHISKSSKNTVTISRGLIGSYNLSFNDSSIAYKVKRLK